MHSDTPRLKRLRIRAWRRGTKEMDLILGSFVNQHLPGLSGEELDALEALMAENDAEIYPWFTGQAETPTQHRAILEKIRATTKLF